MNKLISLFILVSMSAFSAAAAVKTGAMAPDFTLTAVDGTEIKLSEHKGKTIVLEWVNPGCPFVKKFYSEGAMQRFQKMAKEMGVVWLSINSTNPMHRDYLSVEESLSWAQKHGVNSIWLLDEDGKVGKSYNAVTTPHMFIINPAGMVVYQGAIDSIRDAKPASVEKATNYVMSGLQAMMAGKALPESETIPYGCSVKYP